MKNELRSRTARIAFTVAMLAILGKPFSGQASTILGTAQNFTLLSAESITNLNATTINGSLGLSPGTSITGLGDITLTGNLDLTDGAALQVREHQSGRQ